MSSARSDQQPPGGELDGAAQRDRRLRSGKRPLDTLHRRRRVRISCATRSPKPCSRFRRSKLRVITPNVGGGFGMKAFVYPEQALVVWASRKIARPVKWQEDRSEGFISDNQGRDHATQRRACARREAAASSACASRSSPISAPISRRSAPSCRRARPISSPGIYTIAGHPRQRQRRVHQHRAGLRLSRRRAAGSRLPARAPGRRRRARTRHERPTPSAASISCRLRRCPTRRRPSSCSIPASSRR